MAINLIIQADVIDISVDIPKETDIFLVDTNVWLWQTYFSNRPSSKRRVQSKILQYTPYLGKALANGSILTYSGLIFAELAHVIEMAEYDIYKTRNNKNLDLKEYRHNYPTERANVADEVNAAWNQVEEIAVPVNLEINDIITNAALVRFQTQALDGYDLLLLEAICRAGTDKVQVLTDDMDYAVVPNIQLFTSNKIVIKAARAQDRLLNR